jgi:hypothetical protein
MRQRVLERVSDEACGWLRDAWAAAGTGEYDVIAAVFAAAPRRLRGIVLSPVGGDSASQRETDPFERLARGPADQVLRSAMFLVACDTLTPESQSALAARLFATGDNAERCAILRALPEVSDPSVMVETAIEACRSNVLDVFTAISCENPYPARWFADTAFNQMVMKAVFTGIALERIVGLELRRNEELRRMANDYSAERRAAGRSVPADLGSISGEGS